MKDDTKELSDEFDMEQWLERESRPYKMTRGASGMQLNVKDCPTCDDGRWRTYLNAESGVGNCFVCNARFTKFGFVHQCLGFDPDDKSPGGRAHWVETFKHVKEALSEQGWRPKRTAVVAVEMGEVKLPESFELPTPEGQNLVYLSNRGIDNDLAKYFHLRFCTRGKFAFIMDDGRPGGQTFDGRIIIPVFDLDGVLRTFQGRIIDPAYDGPQKYLFPKGLPGTGRYLFSGQNAHRAKRVCMGEGVFDVMALKKAFDEESSFRDIVPIGSFGKHMSYGSMNGDDQLGRFIQLKTEGLEEVTIMWDGEPKALLAALDAASLLHGVGLRARVALLPADKDPNEVVGEVVRAAFQNATPYSAIQAIKWRLKNPYKSAKV
jgi:DNA primase